MGTPGEVPLRGWVVPPIRPRMSLRSRHPCWSAAIGRGILFGGYMDIEIKDTPYNDRCCGNCGDCGTKSGLRYCFINHAFVAKNKWCAEWHAEDRDKKFEN